jgi:hypothetical protein
MLDLLHSLFGIQRQPTPSSVGGIFSLPQATPYIENDPRLEMPLSAYAPQGPGLGEVAGGVVGAANQGLANFADFVPGSVVPAVNYLAGTDLSTTPGADLMDAVGVARKEPESLLELFAMGGGEGIAAMGPFQAIARRARDLAGVPGLIAREIDDSFVAAPGITAAIEAAAGGGARVGEQLAADAGYGEVGQMSASVLAGLAAGLSPAAATRLASSVMSTTPGQAVMDSLPAYDPATVGMFGGRGALTFPRETVEDFLQNPGVRSLTRDFEQAALADPDVQQQLSEAYPDLFMPPTGERQPTRMVEEWQSPAHMVEGDLLFEIPRSRELVINGENLPSIPRNDRKTPGKPLSEVMDWPELYEAYPQLANDVDVAFEDLGIGFFGGFVPDSTGKRVGSIRISESLRDNPEMILDIVAHETQHAIASLDDSVPQGSNLLASQPAASAARAWIRQQASALLGKTPKGDVPPGTVSEAVEIMNRLEKFLEQNPAYAGGAGFERLIYDTDMGEALANASAVRAAMSPEELRNTPVFETFHGSVIDDLGQDPLSRLHGNISWHDGPGVGAFMQAAGLDPDAVLNAQVFLDKSAATTNAPGGIVDGNEIDIPFALGDAPMSMDRQQDLRRRLFEDIRSGARTRDSLRNIPDEQLARMPDWQRNVVERARAWARSGDPLPNVAPERPREQISQGRAVRSKAGEGLGERPMVPPKEEIRAAFGRGELPGVMRIPDPTDPEAPPFLRVPREVVNEIMISPGQRDGLVNTEGTLFDGQDYLLSQEAADSFLGQAESRLLDDVYSSRNLEFRNDALDFIPGETLDLIAGEGDAMENPYFRRMIERSLAPAAPAAPATPSTPRVPEQLQRPLPAAPATRPGMRTYDNPDAQKVSDMIRDGLKNNRWSARELSRIKDSRLEHMPAWKQQVWKDARADAQRMADERRADNRTPFRPSPPDAGPMDRAKTAAQRIFGGRRETEQERPSNRPTREERNAQPDNPLTGTPARFKPKAGEGPAPRRAPDEGSDKAPLRDARRQPLHELRGDDLEDRLRGEQPVFRRIAEFQGPAGERVQNPNATWLEVPESVWSRIDQRPKFQDGKSHRAGGFVYIGPKDLAPFIRAYNQTAAERGWQKARATPPRDEGPGREAMDDLRSRMLDRYGIKPPEGKTPPKSEPHKWDHPGKDKKGPTHVTVNVRPGEQPLGSRRNKPK